jgi:hypothetical protein
MPHGTPSPPTDPIAADERAIATEVARAGLTNGPLRHVYTGFLRAVPEIRTLVARAHEPMPPEVQREAVQGIVRQATGEIARELARLMLWTIGAALAGAFLAGAGVVGIAWWLSPMQTNLGPLSAEAARVLRLNNLGEALARGRKVPQTSGGKAKAIIVWTEPPPAQAGR